MDKPILKTVKHLGAYIYNIYKMEYKREISPLKLQKALYFLFAYWGAFIRQNKQLIDEGIKVEVDYNKYSEYLFLSPIEAWVYGPVVPEVYYEKNIKKYYRKNMFQDSFVKQYVDDWCSQIFQVSDFRLVDIAHSDKVWKKYFNIDNVNPMPYDEIIDEYINAIALDKVK